MAHDVGQPARCAGRNWQDSNWTQAECVKVPDTALKCTEKVPWSTFLGGSNLMVAVMLVLPSSVTGFGARTQDEFGGPPLQVIDTGAVKLPSGVNVIV